MTETQINEESNMKKEAKPDVEQPKDQPVASGNGEQEAFLEPTDVWTHPEHKKGCLFATLCKFGVIGLSVLALLIRPFKDHNGDRYAFSDVWCNDNGLCIEKTESSDLNITESSGVMYIVMDWYLFFIIIGCDVIELLALVAFWSFYFANGKVKNGILVMVYMNVGICAYLKFVTGWMMVSCITDINHMFAWGTPQRDRLYNKQSYDAALKLSTITVSFLFFAFCLDIICMSFLIVSVDEGIPEMPHRMRLMLEEKARLREEELERRPSRRKSYAPEEISHHDQKMSEMSLSKGELLGSKSNVKSGAPSDRGSMSTRMSTAPTKAG